MGNLQGVRSTNLDFGQKRRKLPGHSFFCRFFPNLYQAFYLLFARSKCHSKLWDCHWTICSPHSRNRCRQRECIYNHLTFVSPTLWFVISRTILSMVSLFPLDQGRPHLLYNMSFYNRTLIHLNCHRSLLLQLLLLIVDHLQNLHFLLLFKLSILQFYSHRQLF